MQKQIFNELFYNSVVSNVCNFISSIPFLHVIEILFNLTPARPIVLNFAVGKE